MATKKTAKKSPRKPEGSKSAKFQIVSVFRSPKTGAFVFTAKKPTGKQGAKASRFAVERFTVERSSETGALTFNGAKASQLINKHPQVKIQRPSVKPKHLSEQKIAEMVKSMKVG